MKLKTKTYYNKKHRTRHEDIQVGDKAYRRNRQPSTTRGPWEPEPHQVTKVVYNQITGTRDHTNSKRDRGDWKLVKQRPAHLQYRGNDGSLPTIEEVFDEEDMDDPTPIESIRPNTRAAARQAAAAAANIEPIAAAQQEDLIASDDELVEDFRHLPHHDQMQGRQTHLHSRLCRNELRVRRGDCAQELGHRRQPRQDRCTGRIRPRP